PAAARRDAAALADHLVQTELLSRYQADKLLGGVTRGLALGPFHILAPLGKGGMGSVYLARDTWNRRVIALKVLPPKVARRERRLLARFQREMDLSQRVRHPVLTMTYGAGVVGGVHYIAMEYIPG